MGHLYIAYHVLEDIQAAGIHYEERMKQSLKWMLAVTVCAILGARPLTGQPGRGALSMEFGPTQPNHEQLHSWVAGNPRFRSHLAWLSNNIDLPQNVPVIFQSCGVVNAFYHPGTRNITFCYEYLSKRAELVRTFLMSPTPEQVNDAVYRQSVHVINHELGHALIHQLDLPVLGREEDAADGFSAFILLERGGPQDAYSVLEGALSNSQHGLFENGRQDDEHSLNEQRYFNLLCWMLGSDTARFAEYARKGRLPSARQKRCPSEWAQLRASWVKVLGPHLRPATTIAENAFNPRPVTLAENQTINIAAGSYDPIMFHTNAPECHASVDVVALEGGNRDVETLVMENYSFLSWQSGGQVEPIGQSARVRKYTADVPIVGSGDYVVVINNKFSFATPKVVRATIRVACP